MPALPGFALPGLLLSRSFYLHMLRLTTQTFGGQMSRRKFRLVVMLLLLAVTITQLGAQDPPPGVGGRRPNIREFLGLGAPPDPAAAERGAPLFAANCAFCHGPKARGAEGPNLIRS